MKHDETITVLVKLGLTNPEIARRLDLTPKQVRGRVYKLGLRRKVSIRDEIPMPVRLPTPDDGVIAELVGRYT